MLKIEQNRLVVKTKTLAATFEAGILTSLKSLAGDKELVRAPREGLHPLQLLYAHKELSPLGGHDGDSVTVLPINDHRAEIRFESWYGDGVVAISEDPQTGDLIIEPSAYASRPGLRAVQYMLFGLDTQLQLVAPFFQGVRLPLEDPLIHNTRWPWPAAWEAGLAILQGEGQGFWIHCRDTQYRYKALQVGRPDMPRCLGLETEAYGPMDGSLAAGGLAWRINVYQGDWTVPAASYRDWLSSAWNLSETPRPDWLSDLRFAISWCPTDPAILDALAKRLHPAQVLLHIPRWRTDAYDENYPTFTASPDGRRFIQQAKSMGFRTMPHFNSIDMDPTHPAYLYLRDFQYRALESKRVEGWVWHQGGHAVMESNAARTRHRDMKTMVKIHPGLSMWRSILTQNVKAAVDDLGLDTAFLDVTLNTWNLHNCLVENQTPTEGMNRLIAQVATINNGLAVGGEGRNEITMQHQALAQVHLFNSWQQSCPGLDRLEQSGACPLNEFLFGQWCRSFGYTALSGATPDQETRMRLHIKLGAMPTVTIRSAKELEDPNTAVNEMIQRGSA